MTLRHLFNKTVLMISVCCLCRGVLLTTPALAQPVASFTASQNNGCSPLNVQFNNTSTGAVSYFWDFGDGNSSTLINPSNIYSLPGIYDVTLVATSSIGQNDTLVSSGLITVQPNPVAAFTAQPLAACAGTPITFTNNSVNGVSWLWDFGDGNTSTSQNPTHSFQYAGNYTIQLIAYDAVGCSDIQINSQYITIHPIPVPTITVNMLTSCNANQVFSFNASGTGITSWFWNFGDGNTSTQQNPNHVYGTYGIFPVTLVTTNSFGCTYTSNYNNITVASLPLPIVTANVTGGCSPLTVSFNSTVSGNITSYAWNFGDNGTASFSSGNHLYNYPGSYTVQLTVTNNVGCTATAVYPNLINVSTLPTSSFTITDTMGCRPFTTQFINTSTNATSYYWNFGDGGTSTQANPTYTYVNGGTYNVQLIATTAAGCSRSTTVNAAIDVTSPIAGFSGYPRAGCAPLTVSFTNISYGNNLTYFWNFGDGNTSTLPNPVHTYNTFGNYDVTLIVTDGIGCTDTITRINYVLVNSPTASFSPQPTTQGCAPLTAQFTDNTAGAISWFWDFGDGDTSTLQSPTHIFTTPGFYTVQLTIQFNGGCVQTVSNFSTFHILGAQAGFTVTNTICPPYDAFFTDTSQNAVSWFWTFGDGNTSTQQHPTHTYSAPGYYNITLTITDNNGCSHTTMLANAVYFAPFGASYTAIPQDTTYPMPVNFFANSIGATGWFWDFGDGGTSNSENPTHTYLTSGLYTVTLTITNGTCTQTYVTPPLSFGTDTLSGPPILPSNPPQPRTGCAPFTVAFNDAPVGMVSWLWDFGDGDSSTLQFPVHTYLLPGVYTVTLNAIDGLGNPHYLFFPNYVIASGPVANFGLQLNTNCNSTVVNFVDSSYAAVHWFWNFGDGSPIDSTQNPSHVYPSGFSNNIVTLTVTDSIGCSNSLARQVVSNFVSAIITLQPEVCLNDTVNFNTSFLYYNSYLWDFGDGNTSTMVAPSHVYTAPGSYTVTLTVVDNIGCSQTFTSAVPMDVFNPVAAFTTVGTRNGCDTLTVEFVNNSTGADHYYWDFGDSTISTAINPIHTYNSPGQYTVTLVAFKGICSSVSTMPNYINVTNVIANFILTQSSQCLPFTVNFTDASTNAVSWQWDFGDSTFSTLQNPSHIYTTGPDSSVTLTVTNAAGCTADTSVTIPYFDIGISTGTVSGCHPVNVLFYDLSNNAVSWLWDFGDGGTSTLQYPSHGYDSTGSYTVTLIATSASGCTDTVTVPNMVSINMITSDFTSPATSGCAPTLINFIDQSINPVAWFWDFGDNSTSTLQNPSHIYNQPGVYTVRLITHNVQGCYDTIVKPNYITILGPVTNFSVSATSGCNPLSVSFTDSSINAVSWSWGFGDGNNSTSQNPQHTYTDTGSFTVTLITWDSSGCSSYYTLPQPITIHPVPQASFTASSLTGCSPHTVLFTNTSTGHDTVSWDFGDGNTSTQNNPSHTYLNGGNYYVTLVAITQYGCTDTAVSAQPIVVHQTPDAAFTVDSTGGCPPLNITFINQSANLVGASFFWDFGNGNTSTQANPTETFINPGFYTVSLIVTNANGCSDTLVEQNYIQVYDTIPPAISPILSVSVTSNTSVDITWQNNAATDLMAYILYRLNPVTGNYNVVYTDTNVSNTSFSLTSTYTENGLNTLANTYTYKLLTVDRCGYAIPLDSLTAHTTINVSAATMVDNVQVSWTPYGGCPVSTYEIYRSSPYSPWQYVASVSPNTFTYLDTALDCPYNYSYRITATALCGTGYISNSDTAVGTPVNTYFGQTVNVVRSTVVANSSILTEWLPPVVEPTKVTQYDIYRSEDNVNFAHIATVPAQQTDYMDYSVDVQAKNYFYRVDVINVCNIQAIISNEGSSILLKGDKLYDGGVHLFWTPYVGWNVPVQKYIIERLDENGQWQVIGDVNGMTTTYDDH